MCCLDVIWPKAFLPLSPEPWGMTTENTGIKQEPKDASLRILCRVRFIAPSKPPPPPQPKAQEMNNCVQMSAKTAKIAILSQALYTTGTQTHAKIAPTTHEVRVQLYNQKSKIVQIVMYKG